MDTCPVCNWTGYIHNIRVIPSIGITSRYPGRPRCEHCGAIQLESGEWVKECEKCGKRVDTLYALFVPHLCKKCDDAARESDRANGNTCLICGQPRHDCCC